LACTTVGLLISTIVLASDKQSVDLILRGNDDDSAVRAAVAGATSTQLTADETAVAREEQVAAGQDEVVAARQLKTKKRWQHHWEACSGTGLMVAVALTAELAAEALGSSSSTYWHQYVR
jgi:hypothetical protein